MIVAQDASESLSLPFVDAKPNQVSVGCATSVSIAPTRSPCNGGSVRKLQTVRISPNCFRSTRARCTSGSSRIGSPHAFQIKHHGWYVPESDVRRLIRQGHPAALRMDGPTTTAPAGTRSTLATPARIPHRRGDRRTPDLPNLRARLHRQCRRDLPCHPSDSSVQIHLRRR